MHGRRSSIIVNSATKLLHIRQNANVGARYSGLALILCLFVAGALATPLSAQTFLPPTSSPTGFWNATPVVHFTSTGDPDIPKEAYLGLRLNGVSWPAIETSRGTYNWSGIDHYTNAGGNFLYTFLKVPAWANSSGEPYMAPSDVSTSAECQGVLAGTYTTDCQYKEFVTAFMQHICPTSSTCKIRNFEAWNEFSSNGYWDDTWQRLATMSEDADRIVKAYCTNCQFGAGSVSAGGVGWNDAETNTRNSAHPHWTYYDEALGDFLTDWKNDRAADPSIPQPDFISWHAYSAYAEVTSTQALTPQPMPEYSYSGDGQGNGGNTGSSACTIANESRTTNKYCVDSVVTQAATIGAMTSSSTYGVQGKAFWATEGGFNALASMENSDNNDWDSNNPKAVCTGSYDPVCTADVIRSAYLARWLILLRAAGAGRAYWYSWDEPCFGTLYGMDAAQDGSSIPCSHTYNPYDNPNNPNSNTLYDTYGTKTRAGNTWDQIQLWLNGASMPTGCSENQSTHIYSCTITRSNPAGYVGLIVWYTPWLQTTNYTPPAGYTQYRKVDSPTPVSYSSGSVKLGAEPIIFEKKS